MAKPIVLTGDRPTGKLHLGHFIGSIKNRVKLQDTHEQFIMVADMQALTDNADNPDKVRSSVHEVVMDNIAAGVDPAKTTIFIQSMIPEISELALLFMNLVTVARLRRNPTVKDEMKEKGFDAEAPVGFFAYPISQASDILSFKADVVPVGVDQLPMIEQTNEIVEKFNRIYSTEPPVFKKVKGMVPETEEAARLPGLDGTAKMSKSLGNCIYLSDTPEEVEKKVMAMFTDPDHIHKDDPGKVEGNVVFTYLTAFDADTEGLAKLKEEYRKGGVGDVEIKKRLVNVLDELLSPIRDKRENIAKNPDFIREVLEEGTKKASKVAAQTLQDAKQAMKINYF